MGNGFSEVATELIPGFGFRPRVRLGLAEHPAPADPDPPVSQVHVTPAETDGRAIAL